MDKLRAICVDGVGWRRFFCHYFIQVFVLLLAVVVLLLLQLLWYFINFCWFGGTFGVGCVVAVVRERKSGWRVLT